MASSRPRINTLARIRARQKKLNPNEKISILRGLKTFELKRIEKSLNAKVLLSGAGVDTSNINVVDTKTVESLSNIARAIKAEAPSFLAAAANKLARANKAKLADINKQLAGVEGFGNVEFLQEALKRPVSPKSKLIKSDTKTLINAIFEEDFVESTVKELVRKTNNALRLQGLEDQAIKFDEFDIQSTIDELNRVAQRTKNIARYVEFDEDIIDEDFTF